MKKIHLLFFILVTLLNFSLQSCQDPCKGVGCLNDGVCDQGDCLCLEGFSGENCEIIDEAFFAPQLNCGTDWTQDCFNKNWTTRLPTGASIRVASNCHDGNNCLILVNPHDPAEINPNQIILTTFLENIKEGAGYIVKCTAKFKGYPDVLNNPAFAFYAYSNNNNWYGELYYFSTPETYHETDWMEYSYSFIGGEEETLEFELNATYDSIWISNFVIEEF